MSKLKAVTRMLLHWQGLNDWANLLLRGEWILPPEAQLSFEFDFSPTLTGRIWPTQNLDQSRVSFGFRLQTSAGGDECSELAFIEWSEDSARVVYCVSGGEIAEHSLSQRELLDLIYATRLRFQNVLQQKFAPLNLFQAAASEPRAVTRAIRMWLHTIPGDRGTNVSPYYCDLKLPLNRFAQEAREVKCYLRLRAMREKDYVEAYLFVLSVGHYHGMASVEWGGGAIEVRRPETLDKAALLGERPVLSDEPPTTLVTERRFSVAGAIQACFDLFDQVALELADPLSEQRLLAARAALPGLRCFRAKRRK
jgi:hypothetical protein